VRDPEQGLTGRPPASSRLTRSVDRLAWYASAVGLERWARLAAVAAVPLFLSAGGFAAVGPVFAGLATYVLLTALARRGAVLRAADLLVAAAVIAATGGQVVPFLLFLMVAVAGPAAAGGVGAGLAAGGTLSIVLLATLAWTGDLPQIGLGGALPATLLLPLAGVTAASAAQVLDDRGARDRQVLEEANRLLSALRALADDIPGGLDVSTVSAAVLAELRSIPGAGSAMVYTEDRGLFQPSASAGWNPSQVPTLRLDELRTLCARAPDAPPLTPRDLPHGLQRLARDHRCWAVRGVGEDEALVGALLLGFDDPQRAAAATERLSSIAEDAALALENARLFDGTRVRAADAARRRIAGDLHDGVAQSLAHLRMELELLARSGGEDGAEAARLARVAGTALQDLRATIAGLRRSLDGDLRGLLEHHLAEVDSASGPRLGLHVGRIPELDPERTEDVLRIVQEAVSNALRHARASRVDVRVDRDGSELTVAVEDDGIGPTRRSVRPGTGIGLPSMRERAERLGGRLEVGEGPAGGTVVGLRCPLAAPPEPARQEAVRSRR
jgi:signal transduction histidine kinase